jgi:hypothetical protein
MTEAFYIPDGDAFVSTKWTMGPWDPNSQHAGPPSALFGRQFEQLPSDMPMQIARFTNEILRPIPIARLRIDARVARPGKRVQFCEATMRTDDDEIVARASAWRIRLEDGASEPTPNAALDFAKPDELERFDPPWAGDVSYSAAVEWRFARGNFIDLGPATGWMRLRVPLLPGEEVTPLTRVLAAADSGNGISHEIAFGEALFINTELTVHLFRYPETEWVCLDATTHQSARGIGLAESRLWDERGLIGGGAQSLYIGAR